MTLKLRAKVNFPATVTANGGLQVVKSNGIWTVSPKWTDLTLETTIPNPAGRQLWTFDPTANIYYRLSVQALINSLPAGPAGPAGSTGAGYGGTSATSLLIANSTTKVFTTQAGLAYQVGNYVRASSAANGANFMEGLVSAYSGTSLSIAVSKIGGSGTYADWAFQTAGAPGAGDLLSTNNLSDVANTATARTNLGAAPLASPTFTGTPAAPTAAVDTNTTQLATTAYVLGQASAVGDGNPAMDGSAARGSSTHYARADHVHPTDTSRQAADAQLFSNIPQNSQSAAYTLVATDAQKHIYHPSSDNNARTFTIPANASVAYPVGTAITFVNEINTVTIAITSDTLTLAGAGSTGSRSLAANGIATAIKVASTKWVISGTGLT